MLLQLLDIVFTFLHLVIIFFNLFGWVWPKTRRVHLYSIIATAASWFVLGIWFGWGYCPITDWQWDIKEKLGEQNLPNSFIKYWADIITGENVSATFIDSATAILFAIAAIISVYVNFFRKTSVTTSGGHQHRH